MDFSTAHSLPEFQDQSCSHQPVSEGACTHCQKLLEVELQLSAAQSLVADLKHARCEIKSEINQANDTLLKAFPTEIICRIFKLSISTFTVSSLDLEEQSAPSPSISPLRLGAICKAWRNIAWSTPELWAYIQIWLNSEIFLTSAGYKMVEAWLKRSGSLPLSIRVHKTLPYQGMTIEGVEQPRAIPSVHRVFGVMQLINGYRHRWQMVDLQLPTLLLEEIAKETSSVGEPSRSVNLKMLRIQTADRELYDRPYHTYSPRFTIKWCDDDAPTDFRLLNCRLELMRGINWTNLTRLVTMYAHPDELITIITNAPSLEECNASFMICPPNPGTTPETGPYVHRSLRRMTFRTEHPQTTIELFRAITLPSLTHFVLAITGATFLPQNSQIMDYVKAFLARSQPELQSFVLDIPEIPLPRLHELISILPTTLISLTLIRDYEPALWTDIFIRLVLPCPESQGQLLLPNLRRISFGHPEEKGPGESGWKLITDTLEHTLSNRKDAFVKNLKEVNILYQIALNSMPSWSGGETVNITCTDVCRLAGLVEMDEVPLGIWMTSSNGERLDRVDLIRARDWSRGMPVGSVYTFELPYPTGPYIPVFL